METMGYAAVNAGLNEICCPQSILNRQLPVFPVITSNLIRKSTKGPVAEPFVIKSVGSIRVGILGILPANALSDWPDSSYIDQYDIISPELAINQYLPELKQKTDLVILLSLCSPKATRLFVQNTKGIDVAIVSGKEDTSAQTADDCKKNSTGDRIIKKEPVILDSGSNGTTIGYLEINFSEDNDIIDFKNSTNHLDSSVPEDLEIKTMIDSYLHDPIRLKRLRILQNPKHKNEIEAVQQLSPEEYVKTLQK